VLREIPADLPILDARHVARLSSGVRLLIFERMTDIEKRFAGNDDDGSLIERQLLSGASVKRESRTSPTKNRVANLTPLRPEAARASGISGSFLRDDAYWTKVPYAEPAKPCEN
jgi:hypothetical protein